MEAVSSGLGTSSLWSFTPKRSLVPDNASKEPTSVLITASGQIGHILESMVHAERKTNLFVLCSDIESMARDLLLLAIAIDVEVSVEERSEMFLEVFANLRLRKKTHIYLNQVSKKLIRLIRREHNNATPIELDNLKYSNLDDLEQCIAYDCNQQLCDIESLREHRLRGYYRERYDSRANLIDWDYVMNLKKLASIIEQMHFTQWRMLGQAFEVRDAMYTVANRTLVSYRTGKKKSTMTSVKVLGYWGDIIASPYVAFGVEAHDRPDLFDLRGGQHKHTACDVARHNIQQLFQRLLTKNPSNVKIVPIMEVNKAKFQHRFDGILMPIQSRLQPADLTSLMRPRCHIRIEAFTFLPSLSEKIRIEYEAKMSEMAANQGWSVVEEAPNQPGEESKQKCLTTTEAFLHFIAA